MIFSTLWPKNYRVLAELARRGAKDFATLNGLVTPLVQDAVAKSGSKLTALNELISPARAQKVQSSFAEAFTGIQGALAARPLTLAGWSGRAPHMRLTEVVLERVRSDGLQMFGLLEGLNALAERFPIEAVVLNETDTNFARLAARWAQSRGIRRVLLAHGTNLGADYTVTGNVLAERILVFGERGAAHFRHTGIAAERITITGNPAWDEYPTLLAQRAQIRTHVFNECRFDPSLPAVMFGTTWKILVTRLQEDTVVADTTRSFFKAVKILRDRGVAFNCIIKDRPSNAQFGPEMVAAIAREERVEAYQYAAGRSEYGLLAADVLVAFDSNLFVEGMFCGLPCINMWSPSSWLMGPSYGAADGIPFASREEPERIADLIERSLRDADFRGSQVARMLALAHEFHRPLDGQAAQRCAEAILVP